MFDVVLGIDELEFVFELFDVVWVQVEYLVVVVVGERPFGF